MGWLRISGNALSVSLSPQHSSVFLYVSFSTHILIVSKSLIRLKGVFVIREVHRFNQRFATIQEFKEKIMDEFSDQLPETLDFQIGYYHGKQSAKRWIITQEDLNLMYE